MNEGSLIPSFLISITLIQLSLLIALVMTYSVKSKVSCKREHPCFLHLTGNVSSFSLVNMMIAVEFYLDYQVEVFFYF